MSRSPPSNQITPGFRPDLLPGTDVVDPLRGRNALENSRVDAGGDGESDTEEIIKTMNLTFLDKVRIKLMSVEEKEAFLIEKVETEKRRRRTEKQRPCNCSSARDPERRRTVKSCRVF